ncbi:Arc family DNA-binding protein [Sorlinia euscelidii]|uniref:Arc-like DNA binding domain-containing protein n=1 Tax=Sorlinia euscelidii TaxID=3081148 RepID=A0ABU7U3J0_9PROT
MATRDDPQFRIRLPWDLKERLENIAEQEGRSLNSEIQRRLERSLDVAKPTSATQVVGSDTHQFDAASPSGSGISDDRLSVVLRHLNEALDMLKASSDPHSNLDENPTFKTIQNAYLDLVGLSTERSSRRQSFQIREGLSDRRLQKLEDKVESILQKLSSLSDD